MTGIALGYWLNDAFAAFLNDPPDHDFQCGYLVALLTLADELKPAGLNPQTLADARRLLVRPHDVIAAYQENA